MAVTSYVKAKLSFTPEGETKVSTQGLVDVGGFGASARKVGKIPLLDESTVLSVGRKELEQLNFKLPYSETSSEFHDVVVTAYDANKEGALEIEFDNKITPDTGTGTKISGTAKVTSNKPENQDDAMISAFTAEWDGAPTLTKAT